MLPSKPAIEIREYLDRANRNHFRAWMEGLHSEASRKVATALYRVEIGNFSNVRSAGSGVSECKINFGPGYRVYFGKDGDRVVMLLGGGSKKRQQHDICIALAR